MIAWHAWSELPSRPRSSHQRNASAPPAAPAAPDPGLVRRSASKRSRADAVVNPYVQEREDTAGEAQGSSKKVRRAAPSQRQGSSSFALMPWRQPKPKPSSRPAFTQRIAFEVEIYTPEDAAESDDNGAP